MSLYHCLARPIASVLLVLACASLVACSSSARRGGASLGDAAEASAKKAEQEPDDPADRREASHEERTRERSGDPPPLEIGEKVDEDSDGGTGIVVGSAALAGEGEASDGEAIAEKRDERWHLTPTFSLLGVAGDAYELNWAAGLELGSYVSNRVRVEGGAQFIDMEFLDSQERVRGLEKPWELQADLRGRFYLTKAHTFASAYAVVGFKLGAFGWEFAAPLEVVEDGAMRTISSDMIFTFTPYIGAGIAPVQWGSFHFGASFTLGARLFKEATVEGFENDLFPDVGTWELRLDASYFF